MISSIYCFFNSEVRNEIVFLIQRKLLQHNPNTSLFNNHVNNERFNSKRLRKASSDPQAAQNLIQNNNTPINNNTNNNDHNYTNNLNNLPTVKTYILLRYRYNQNFDVHIINKFRYKKDYL